MNKIFLIKTTDTFQLSHLYEHIYFAHLDTFFRNKGMYQPIDYTLDARTHSNGVVVVEIEIYVHDIDELFFDDIKNIKINVEDEIIDLAIGQIISETAADFNWEPYDRLRSLIEQIDEIPWQTLDEIETININTNGSTIGRGFYIVSEDKTGLFELELSIASSTANGPLAPLYRQVAGTIMYNYSLDVSDSCGYSIISDAYTMGSHRNMIARLRMTESEVDEKYLKELYDQLVVEMIKDKVFSRLISNLSHLDYLHNPYCAPNPETTMDDIGAIVGSAGWKKLATQRNLEKILNSLEVSFTTH